MKYMTRKQKREKQKEINLKLKKVKDKRHQSYIEYTLDIILFSLLMKNITSIESMNQMTIKFNTEESINNIGKVLGYDNLEELPHYDTINNFLKKLNPIEIEQIRKYMIIV